MGVNGSDQARNGARFNTLMLASEVMCSVTPVICNPPSPPDSTPGDLDLGIEHPLQRLGVVHRGSHPRSASTCTCMRELRSA